MKRKAGARPRRFREREGCADRMKFKEFGKKACPTVILLHSEGLSWWSLEGIVRFLQKDYHVVTPVIDGHGEDGMTTFLSIQDSAEKLVRYIDADCGGKVLAIVGLCMGAQIALEALSQRADIAGYAILESVSVCPAEGAQRLMVPARVFCGAVCWRWPAKIRAKRLFLPGNMLERYFSDRSKMSGESLANVIRSSRNYTLPDGVKNTGAKVLIIVGTKELRRMDRSVRTLMNAIPDSQICIAPGTRHGGFTLAHSMEYLALIRRFME